MAIDVSTLNELATTDITQATALATQLLSEKFPNIDTKRGVISELIIGLDAILHAAQLANLELERKSRSLYAIGQTPELADDDIVNAVLSNYRMSRRTSVAASGALTIVLSQKLITTIPKGFGFAANGVTYTADATYVARANTENVKATTDRLLVQIATDRYAFTINVTAGTQGSAGNVTNDTAFSPLSSITSIVSVTSSETFTSGIDAQTNADLIAMLDQGIATRAWSNRSSIPGMIRNADSSQFTVVTSAFATIQDMSIVGHGDAEMQRDQHTLFPVSTGGRCDVYLRTDQYKKIVKATKSATLIKRTAAGGLWQMTFAKTDFPGFYEISKIVLQDEVTESTQGYTIKEDLRGVDLTGTGYTPDIAESLEGVYSKYQTATIRFEDTDTAFADSDVETKTQNYDITVEMASLVSEVQDFLSDRRVRSPGADILVKAAIPCDISLGFATQRNNTTEIIDFSAIKTALAKHVNTRGFSTSIYAGSLAGIVTALLPANIEISAIDIVGRIRKPDGAAQYITDNNVLTIPETLTAYTSGRTTAFFLDENSIEITDATSTAVLV